MKNKDISQTRFRWLYLTGFFLILTLPLLAVPPLFHPPDWGKTIVFRIIFSILFFTFIFQLLFFRKEEVFFFKLKQLINKKSDIFLPFWLLISLLFIFFLATVFSLDFRFSFLGSPYRAGGFLNFAFYIAFAILIFLVLSSKDWQKLWKFSLIIGFFACLVAFFQQFAIFEKIFVPFGYRPSSTFGNPIFFGIYLLLLTFVSLSFAIKANNIFKKLFYLFFFLLFIFFIIVIAQTRSAMAGLIIGFFWFIFAYPKKIPRLKIAIAVFLIIGILGIYFVQKSPSLSRVIQENKILTRLVSRLPLKIALEDARVSGWKISFEAIKEKPILGWGPENFSIAFDKYYNPALGGINIVSFGSGWWDRAHGFVFDIAVTAGIPALIIYLLLLGVIFWKIQKLKNRNVNNEGENKNLKIICQGIQATFLGYLVAIFFSFDTFSSYLISFLLIGCTFSLITEEEFLPAASGQKKNLKFIEFLIKQKYIIVLVFFLLIWFIWSFNLKPLKINKEINLAVYYGCEKGIPVMEDILSSHSILDHYLRLNYIDIIGRCIEKSERKIELASRAIKILRENVKLQPYYTRDWLFLGAYENYLLGNVQDLEPQLVDLLITEADFALRKANQLSSKRQQIIFEWAKTDVLKKDYQAAKEKAEICLSLNPDFPGCWWEKGLLNIYFGNVEEGRKDIEAAEKMGYDLNSKTALNHLLKAYIGLSETSEDFKYYQTLAEIYQKLIGLEPNNFQYHASLAFVYRELKEYKKAKEEALTVLKLSPESKNTVEDFLRSLPY